MWMTTVKSTPLKPWSGCQLFEFVGVSTPPERRHIFDPPSAKIAAAAATSRLMRSNPVDVKCLRAFGRPPWFMVGM